MKSSNGNREEKLTKKVYSQRAEREWKRVVQDPYHLLEHDTTFYFLKKYLPKRGLILDAGGGPGRYSIELAKMGYDIILLDLTPANLELAKKKIKKYKVQGKIKGILEGSITNLSEFKDNTFDAVICLGGPLSHVSPESSRKKAVSELIRVAKKNAPIFISVMGKFGTLAISLKEWPQEVAMKKHFEDFSLHGEDYMWMGRHYCHYFTRDELISLLSKKAKVINTIGLEGLSSIDEESANKISKTNPKAWENWLETHYKLCTHPTVVDISGHMMIIGRKR